MKRFDEAEAIFQDVLARTKRVQGEKHRDTLAAQNNLAWLRATRGDFAGAETMYRQILPVAQETFGPDHPIAGMFNTKLGFVLMQQQKWAEAEPFLAAGYTTLTSPNVGSIHPEQIAAYGICLAHLNKPAEAVPILRRADRGPARCRAGSGPAQANCRSLAPAGVTTAPTTSEISPSPR